MLVGEEMVFSGEKRNASLREMMVVKNKATDATRWAIASATS